MRTRKDSKLILELFRKAQLGETITFGQDPIPVTFITDYEGTSLQVITLDSEGVTLDTESGFITIPVSLLSDSNLDVMASAIEGA